MKRVLHLSILSAALAAATGVVASIGGATPTTIIFVLTGEEADEVSVGSHRGTFTSQAPLCGDGTWGSSGGSRIFTCSDGSGTFSASAAPVAELTEGTVGPWVIFSGTGHYATLRGKGIATTGPVSGVAPHRRWTSAWTGTADFDDTVGPSLTRFAAAAVRLRSSTPRYDLRISFGGRDNVESSGVSYRLFVLAGGKELALRTGDLDPGSVADLRLRVRAPRRVRALVAEFELTDPVGNRSARVQRRIRLPGRS